MWSDNEYLEITGISVVLQVLLVTYYLNFRNKYHMKIGHKWCDHIPQSQSTLGRFSKANITELFIQCGELRLHYILASSSH